ncbi:hypothetical protein LAZ67_2004302 [Cordylochernes scorpioides]|uniref:ATP-dependent DNA helicase n=1 Tax=Cordylochernes scorpioides TaxID=51811 RepID=A0ABY6K6K8_9ARAC|nr:hypothetical protein LAZ67_2004302 [Cordylochernes scorpioides]
MPRRGRGRLAYRTRHGNNAPNPISPVPTEYIIGGLDIVCPYCSALHFPGETVGSSCCHKGKVILPTLSSFPYEMMELMTSNSVEAKYFQTNIRSYNSSLAFASMGAQVDVFSGQGPFCYRIHGQIYHLTGPLHPHGNRAPSYAQLYILDSEAANNTRIAASRPLECHPGILTLLDSVLRRVNPYTSAYRQMHQVELAEEHRARIENRQMCQVQMLIRQNHCRDLRRYNAPSVSEVAAIFVDQDGHVPSNRDIAVFPHDCGLVRISPLNPNCDPMTYPLLFPAGDPGWAIGILHEENMRTSTRNHVTMLQFYSYRLAIRPGFSPIHYGRRLFQQYVVDAYVKTEGNRLNYISQNQSLLRVELYQGLLDYIHEQEHSRGVRIGRIFILPSSFPGSSRAMQQNYQDAMAIVRKFGRPDLFVTFTCNPRWTDIVENLLPNQNPSDRPDLVARVFNLKLQQLLHEIVSQHVLGVVIARVHVVEFQKRGLPHAHMLFMLREDKPRDRDAIDMLVCAEIPSPTMQVQLYDMVRKHMIHGPCGNFNLHSPCMSDGKCTKDFPKSFLQLTEANNNGYPRYRRRDDGQTLVVGTHEVDNLWVVPYNPYLLVRFNAHINVEVCASVKSVKYLFKYVYKGHDRAEVEVSVGELDMESRAHDEIKNFLDARYVSAPEAMWRMFEYRLHAHSHTICRLAVHLPNFQSIYFVEGSEEQALENASRRRTTLTAWFQLNCVNVSARSLLYGDIPSAYVFRQNQWSARVRGGALCIGRMCSVNPKDSERYHLRLLLLHVAGAQSFEDLRTVDDIVCSTFKEAAQRRGLLADDSEWDACLAEAALFQMPCQLRQLFATILIYNNPTDPVSLWTKYKGYLSEDFSRATSDAAAEQMTLRELEFQLRENRLSCHHYGLPAPLTPLLHSGEDHLDVNAELQIGTEMYRSLTPDQKSIVDTIVDSLNVNPRCFFIDGPGGAGKTYVYNTLIHCVRAVGKIVIPLASTGIAATLLSGGQTVHSRFKLPIPLLENSVTAISANSSEAELIRRSSLIIWDEAPMAHYRALEIVDRLLKDIMHCDLAFGGKVVVLGGDFRQVLPVVPRASRAEIVAACIKQSKLWPLFVILRLTQNMRAGIDAQSFSQWLLKVGDGDLPTDQQGLISLPESCIFHGVDLVQEIFGSSYGDITALSQSVILTPKNTDSLEINEKVLDRLPNRSQCFLSVDSVECENVEEQNNYPTEFLNSLTPTGMPPHRLNLKIGAIVMLLRNLNPKQGLCNGTRMVIQRMRSHVLEAQILTGTKVGQTVLVPKISLAPSDTNLPFILKRRQFPLRQKYYGLRPYHVENTGSRPITEVKQRRARPEIGKSNQGRIIARGRIIGRSVLYCIISYFMYHLRTEKYVQGSLVDMASARLTSGFHRRVKDKTSLHYDYVPIDDDTTTKPLFTPQEKGRKGMSTFTFDTQFFKQTKGSPMGSPLSTVVAEVVMRSLDQWITSRHSSDIFLWRRYIDDTFCLDLSILEGKELDDLLEGDPPEDEVKFKEWKKKDAQAKGIITCAMTDSLVALILNCKTSKDIWIALHERYEGDKKKMIIEARNDVSRLTMRKEENWEEYLYRAEKLLEQARNLGAEIEDQEFTTSVIRGLPQKYNLVALQLNCQMKKTIPETSEEVENHDDHSHSDLENQDEHSELPYNLRPNMKDKLYYELSSDDEPIEDNEDKDPTYVPTCRSTQAFPWKLATIIL